MHAWHAKAGMVSFNLSARVEDSLQPAPASQGHPAWWLQKPLGEWTFDPLFAFRTPMLLRTIRCSRLLAREAARTRRMKLAAA